MRWIAAVVVILATVGKGVGAVEIGLPAAGSAARFGVSVNIGAPLPLGEFDMLEAAGCGLVRRDILWDWVETSPGVYDFGFFNDLQVACQARNMRNLFILCFTKHYYGEDPATYPSSPAWQRAFVNYAVAVAKNFKGKGLIYELWNEPNDCPNPGMGDPATYAALAKLVYPAMKAVDPTCTIIGPAVSNISSNSDGGATWCRRAYEHGLLSAVDAVSVHPYNGVQPPEFFVFNRASYGGVTKPVVCSEWGVSAAEVSAQTQADYLVRYNLVSLSQGVPFAVWYNWKNNGTDPTHQQQNFGLVTADLEEKPAYEAMRRMTHALRDASFQQRLDVGSTDDWALVFATSSGHKTLAYWTTGETHALSVDGWGDVLMTSSPQYLNPVPEPNALTMAMTGAIGLLAYIFCKPGTAMGSTLFCGREK